MVTQESTLCCIQMQKQIPNKHVVLHSEMLIKQNSDTLCLFFTKQFMHLLLFWPVTVYVLTTYHI